VLTYDRGPVVSRAGRLVDYTKVPAFSAVLPRLLLTKKSQFRPDELCTMGPCSVPVVKSYMVKFPPIEPFFAFGGIVDPVREGLRGGTVQDYVRKASRPRLSGSGGRCGKTQEKRKKMKEKKTTSGGGSENWFSRASGSPM
jgi:hypothetical protein